jgi:DNA-binding transcriptional ArsR family regulator
MWQPASVDPPEAISRVLGRSRARLLAELESPASTTELAARTGLIPGGVSQHLGALHDAGLLSAHRVGRSVLYARTALAEAMLGGGR